MADQNCQSCGLARAWCCCELITSEHTRLEFALLLHENESARPTTTSKIIQKVLPHTTSYTWHRKEPPQQLIERINDPVTNAWLLFPADREDLKPRSQAFRPTKEGQKTLIIVPDGTWKEVRKIVRKSPWLDHLPLLAFDPSTPSRYDLRRNPDADHLCTAETVAELLKLNREEQQASSLNEALDLFIERYKASKLS